MIGNEAEFLGWIFVVIMVGSYLIWRHSIWVKKQEARADAEMRRAFGVAFDPEPSAAHVDELPLPEGEVDAPEWRRFGYTMPNYEEMRRSSKAGAKPK